MARSVFSCTSLNFQPHSNYFYENINTLPDGLNHMCTECFFFPRQMTNRSPVPKISQDFPRISQIYSCGISTIISIIYDPNSRSGTIFSTGEIILIPAKFCDIFVAFDSRNTLLRRRRIFLRFQNAANMVLPCKIARRRRKIRCQMEYLP